jgi:hypothetical protein
MPISASLRSCIRARARRPAIAWRIVPNRWHKSCAALQTLAKRQGVERTEARTTDGMSAIPFDDGGIFTRIEALMPVTELDNLIKLY